MDPLSGFDLFVGAWELKDAQKERIHHIVVVPCLLTTLMFGPGGLVLYWLIKRGIYLRVNRNAQCLLMKIIHFFERYYPIMALVTEKLNQLGTTPP